MSGFVGSRIVTLLVLGSVAAIPAGVLAYRAYTARATYLFDKGNRTVERGDLGEAERIA